MESNSLINKITQTPISDVSSITFLFNILISTVLSLLVAYVYVRFGKTISNRKNFSSIFPILSMVTMFIIYVVKSSLALSLGLVGALSIVRFRSAIKEPEELVFIFFAMAIGLGLGANQVLITALATLIICLFIFLRYKNNSIDQKKFLSLLISYPKKESYDFDKIIEIVEKSSVDINLRRYYEDNEKSESILLIDIESFSKMREMQVDLISEFPKIVVDFVDNSNFEMQL